MGKILRNNFENVLKACLLAGLKRHEKFRKRFGAEVIATLADPAIVYSTAWWL